MSDKKMRVIIIGDSLASFRSEDGIRDECRWPALLSCFLKDVDFINLSKGYSTSRRVRELVGLEGDLLIVQIGIVDCAPRLFSKWETAIVSRLPYTIRKRIIERVKLYRSQSIRRAYVDVNEFRANLEKIKRVGLFRNVFLVEILPASKKFLSKNPLVAEQINHYNHIMRCIADKEDRHYFISSIDLSEVDGHTLEDGYHLNEMGHARMMKSILEKMKLISVVERSE